MVGESDPVTEGAIECLKPLMDIGSMNVLDENANRSALFQKAKDLVRGITSKQPCLLPFSFYQQG